MVKMLNIISKIDKRGSKMFLVDGHQKARNKDNIQVAWRLILNEESRLYKIIDIEVEKISMIVAK